MKWKQQKMVNQKGLKMFYLKFALWKRKVFTEIFVAARHGKRFISRVKLFSCVEWQEIKKNSIIIPWLNVKIYQYIYTFECKPFHKGAIVSLNLNQSKSTDYQWNLTNSNS